MYKNLKNKKCIFIIGLFLLMNLIFTSFSFKHNPIIKSKDDSYELKTSAIYYDVEINDFPGEPKNWTWAKTQSWFGGGSGTSGDPYIIEDHTFEYSAGSGDCFRILNSRKYFVINNCTFINSYQPGSGLFLFNVTNGQIITNQLTNNYDGIYLSLCNDTSISDNLIYDNAYCGVYLEASHFNTISENNVSLNDFRGIRIYLDSTFNTISENDVYDNGIWDGIQLTSGSNDNTVSGNTVVNSGDHGIEILATSLSNIITGNTIINHAGEGIYIYSGCNYNLLYENILKNNGLHAYDDGSNNNWNNTLIGNYWDNYTGYDMDLDGIGDTPYTFIGGSAGSVDYLPIWNIQAPITIDDFPGSPNNWTWATSQAWCNGSGTELDPYIIEDLNIDAKFSDSCISILNSEAHFIIRGCTLNNSFFFGTDAGLYLYNVTNGNIIGNNFYDNGNYAIYGSLSDYNTISSNLFDNNDFGIWLEGSYNEVLDNNIYGNTHATGIVIYGSYSDNIINGNIIENCYQGIGIAYADNNTLSGNNASNNIGNGILIFYQSNFNFLSGNIVVDNIYSGIEILSSNNNTIESTIAHDNTLNGIDLQDSDNNLIYDNDICNNVMNGISVYINSDGNLLYSNCFKGNAKHAIDDGVNNDWNNTVIGNYWDNYTGYDMDLDGIGDTPYTFISGSAGSIDYLPIWNIQGPIAINDFPGNLNNWTWAVSQAWCSGSGTELDPYIIEDLNIDGGGTDNCISVENSNKYFIIQNCKVYNSGTIPFASGIFLFNVTNSQIIGNNASNNEFFGITLLACDNNTISGNTANENVNSHGIYLGGSHSNTISENFAIDNGAYGIMVEASRFNFLSGNSVNNNTNSGIYLYDSSNNNTIVGTTAYYNGNNGIYCVNSNNNTIEDTIAHYNKHNGIYLWNSSNIRILNNELSDSIENGIKMEFSYENWIEGTIAIDNGFNGIYSGWGDFDTFKDTIAIGNGHNGIYLQYNNNCTLLENNLSNSTQEGLKMDFCTENTIEGTIANDNVYDGIYGWAVNNNTIKDSSASGNGHNGIFLQVSNDNIIKQNNLYKSDENGIKFQLCQSNTIFDNFLFNNDLHGIFIEIDSDNNIIYDNVISDNTNKGILIAGGCNDNLFYKNFFLENGKHALDDGSNNDWNSTTIGNYWDNHTGPDISPKDGIVDIQYNISGSAGSIDYLPIAEDGAPQITINSPSEDEVFGIIAPNYNVTITDTYLFEMWYTLDGGLHNYTFTEFTGIINQSAWDTLSDGTITLTFYANDKPRNVGFAEVTIEKDTEAPIIIINSPFAGDQFSNRAPTFSITVIDDNLDSIWYSLDGGLTNFTIITNGTIDQTAWAALTDGSITITFYANDTLGNLASESVDVEKVPPSGGDYLIIIIIIISIVAGVAIVSIAIVIILKKRKPVEAV